ncbi:receptor activity-modifying protein 2 isoform X3 [Protopterus annectens]|uniref:receptor activity-modifying protein 2 isoform X3 n=1 Tax=Protopterus annectens TaxID=7888 RepID=UPI001CFA1563|nr:receptor activity-modifying protein 2 isoform X3 [Protopterus annectens]
MAVLEVMGFFTFPKFLCLLIWVAVSYNGSYVKADHISNLSGGLTEIATSCKGFYGKADRISNLPAGLRDNTSCYAEIIEVVCWAHFNSTMNTRFKNESYCDWSQVMRVYSEFQNCTEYVSEFYCLPYPNPLVEDFFFQAHRTFFSKCNSPPPPPLVMDPPISTLLGMIAIPICLLPFMVLLVVWKTKDGEPQL